MATHQYKIYFLGLICHVGKTYTSKQFAALVDADCHWSLVATKQKCKTVYPGDMVVFKDGNNNDASGNADASDSLFQDIVVHLQSLLGGDLDPDVEAHTGKVAAYAFYPKGGKLYVAWPFKYRGFHVGKHVRNGCVARLTMLEVEAEELKLYVGGNAVEIGNDYTVLVANVAHDSTDYEYLKKYCASLGNGETMQPPVIPTDTGRVIDEDKKATDHFKLFGAMIKGDINCIVRQGKKCRLSPAPIDADWLRDLLTRAGTNVGCGNTNWP